MSHCPTPPETLTERADLLALLERLVAPLRGRFTQGKAGIDLPGNEASYGAAVGRMEAFCRPLWGLLPAALGGAEINFSPWQTGLLSGTHPADPEYWGAHTDHDQRMVETPVLALAFALLPDFWEPYSAAQRLQIAAWLSGINAARPVDNNWLFFRVLTNCALRRRGFRANEDHLAADLARIDQFYLGDGWYADGEGRRGDYYVAMAMHVYGLWYARLAENSDPRKALFEQRARRFASDFECWFDAHGAAVPFGRSLTYRFAQGAFWGALAQSSIQALPWGRIRGHYARHLRWWLSQPIFTEAGVLSVGYAYPNSAMGENYNAPGSPYWALKAFAPLALPEEHPFWTATEEPAPAAPVVLALPHAGLVVAAPPGRDHSVLINAGQPVGDYPRHAAQKYSKFAYSSAFGLCVALGSRLGECGADSMLCVSLDGDRYRHRERCEDSRVENHLAYSAWSPWEKVKIETWLLARADYHVRVHRIQTEHPLHTAETGFAIGYRNPQDLRIRTGTGSSRLEGPSGCSLIADLWGDRSAGCVTLEPGSSLMTPLASVPALHLRLPRGEHWLVCAAAGWPSAPGHLPELTARMESGQLVVQEAGIDTWTSGNGFADCPTLSTPP